MQQKTTQCSISEHEMRIQFESLVFSDSNPTPTSPTGKRKGRSDKQEIEQDDGMETRSFLPIPDSILQVTVGNLKYLFSSSFLEIQTPLRLRCSYLNEYRTT
jgi:hypothetical protein